jgi:hypothetical protein
VGAFFSSLQTTTMKTILILLACLSSALAYSNSSKPSVFPTELTYILPSDFEGNVSESFLQTSSSIPSVSHMFSSAASSPFIAYDQEFLDLLPDNPKLELVASSTLPFADEMGIWIWDHNQASCHEPRQPEDTPAGGFDLTVTQACYANKECQ